MRLVLLRDPTPSIRPRSTPFDATVADSLLRPPCSGVDSGSAAASPTSRSPLPEPRFSSPEPVLQCSGTPRHPLNDSLEHVFSNAMSPAPRFGLNRHVLARSGASPASARASLLPMTPFKLSRGLTSSPSAS